MKNNKGVSLVELIIVIAIMSIMIGAGALGIRAVSTKPAKQGAYNIKMAIQNGRIIALSKETFSLEIKYDSTKKCIQVSENGTYRSLGGEGVSVTYYNEGEASTPVDASVTPIEINFNRATGGFLPNASGKVVNKIEISKAGKTYTLTLYRLTGKVIME